MAKRHSDALAIQQGAVNPSGIAISIVDACREIRAEPGHTGTTQITRDPAVRLMVHQLAYICGLEFGYTANGDYTKDVQTCTDQRNADQQVVVITKRFVVTDNEVEIGQQCHRSFEEAMYDTATPTEREQIEAERRAQQRIADHVDGYDRDDLGESPDF